MGKCHGCRNVSSTKETNTGLGEIAKGEVGNQMKMGIQDQVCLQ